MVGADEMTVIKSAMIPMLAGQQRHRTPAIGELLDRGRIVPVGPPPARRAGRRHDAEQNRHAYQGFHRSPLCGTRQPAAEDPEPNAGFAPTATASSARQTAAPLRTYQGAPGRRR